MALAADAAPARPGARSARAPLAYASWAYLLSAPAFLLTAATIVAPLVIVAAISLTNYKFGRPTMKFVGLDNYSQLFSDPDFWNALRNSATYSAIVVPVSVLLAFVLAALVKSRTRTKRFYEIVFFLPVASTLTAMSIVWSYILNGRIGPIADLTEAIGLGRPDFFSDPRLALIGLAIIGIWQLLGFNFILFLAGFTTLPKEVEEAAALDGIDRFWDRARYVFVPMLAPTTFVVVLLSLIQTFQVFDTIAVLTNGGPSGATDVLLYKIQRDSFVSLKVGYGSALTVVFLMLLGLFAVAQGLYGRKRER